MNNIFLDHTKKYMMIDGHQIELSFAPEPKSAPRPADKRLMR